MNLDEYHEEVQAVSIALGQKVLRTLVPYQTLGLSVQDWLKMLLLIFPDVSDARFEASDIARRFYDTERERVLGEIRETWLANYEFPEFVEAQTHRFDLMSREDLSDRQWNEEVAKFTFTAMNEVQNGARMTMAEATTGDDAAGFARIDPEPPSCGFCTMLISRGPAYSKDEFKKNTFAYHNHDTCILVPVFDEDDWPGKDQYEEAERRYKAAAKEADGDLNKIVSLLDGTS